MYSRIYVKFREEKDWEEFLGLVESYSYEDGEEHNVAEYQDNFSKTFDLFMGGARISKDNLDCLISDNFSEGTVKLNCELYVMWMKSQKWYTPRAIILADTESGDEYYYFGEELHEYHRENGVDEHAKTDIADVRKWLGDERIDQLSYEEYNLLCDLGDARKEQVTEEEAAILKKITAKEEKKTLKDIYPNLNRNADNGLIVKDGICTDMNEYQEEYLGMKFAFLSDLETEDICWYIPPEVVEIDNNDGENDIFFGPISSGFDTLVFMIMSMRNSPKMLLKLLPILLIRLILRFHNDIFQTIRSAGNVNDVGMMKQPV